MRILLDERLRNSFPAHECQTARYAGFAGLKNGELLEAAEAARFDVLLTLDQGLEYEQNLRDRKLAIVILRAKSSRQKDLLPLVHACLDRLNSLKAGEIVRIPDAS